MPDQIDFPAPSPGQSAAVLYWLCGDGAYAETLAVSIASLRRWWSGDVVLAIDRITDPRLQAAAEQLQATFPWVRLLKVPRAACRRHAKYVTKASLWRYSPAEQIVYLDADTVVCGPLDTLWTDQITVTQFSDWVTTGRRISGRLAAARSHLPESLLPPGHQEPDVAINTGVLAWGLQASRWLSDWEQLATVGWRAPLTDEVMLQLMLPLMRRAAAVLVLDDSYNFSPTHGRSPRQRIFHFHGRRHVRRAEGRALWEPHARQALADYPHLATWWSHYDPAVAHLLPT